MVGSVSITVMSEMEWEVMNDNFALTKGCQQSREKLAVAVVRADMHYSYQVLGYSVNLFKAAWPYSSSNIRSHLVKIKLQYT